MTLSGITPLRSFAWAILVGVTAFIVLFYGSFQSSSERETRLLRVSMVKDSLLLTAFHTMREAEDADLDQHEAGERLRATWASLDSVLAHAGISLPDSLLHTLAQLEQYGREVVGDPSAGDHQRRFILYRNAQHALGSYFVTLVAFVDEELTTSVNVWAGMSAVIVVLGFWFTMWLASTESRRTAASERLSSVLSVIGEPVIVYTSQGETVFMNDAFRDVLLNGERSSDEQADRFSYLDTRAEEDRSEGLWTDMLDVLAEASSWSAEVPFTRGGTTRHFQVRAVLLSRMRSSRGEIVVVHTDVSDFRRLHRKAREAEDQYRSIVENSPDALVLLHGGSVVYANAAALDMFGFLPSDSISEDRFSSLFGPAGNLAFQISMSGRSVGDQILQNAEFRATTKQGTVIDVEASASVVRWGDELALQATFRDITERKMLEREQALWSWEQDALSAIDKRLVGIIDLETVLESIIHQVVNLSRAQWAGILMYDGTDRFVRWRAMRGHTNASNEQARFEVTPAVLAVFSSADPLIVQELKDRDRYSMSDLPGLVGEGIISSAWLPLRVHERQEGVLAVGYRSYHAFGEREIRLLSSLAEKTAIALATAGLYDDLLRHQRDLEELSGARVDAQEEERRRIAREIHDGLGQILTAIKLNVEIMEDSPGLDDDDKRKFVDVKNLLDGVMQEARDISYNLMPSVLEDFGLVPALQLLSERFGAQSEVHVQFFSKGDVGRLDRRMEVALYRIVQEALTNSVRHGDADSITVQISKSEDGVRLTVEDNGKGMEEGRPQARRAEGGGIGLASMRERVNSFHGTIEIDSAPGKGTLIIVDMPTDANTAGERS